MLCLSLSSSSSELQNALAIHNNCHFGVKYCEYETYINLVVMFSEFMCDTPLGDQFLIRNMETFSFVLTLQKILDYPKRKTKIYSDEFQNKNQSSLGMFVHHYKLKY